VQLGAVRGREPHVLVVEAEAVRVERDVVGDSRDAWDVDLVVVVVGVVAAGVFGSRGGRGGERERAKRGGRGRGGGRLLERGREGVFFSCSFKKHQPGISSSHQPLLEPVEQSQAQACDRGGLEIICEAEREGEREGR